MQSIISELTLKRQPVSYSNREETLGTKITSLHEYNDVDLSGQIIILGVPDDRGVVLNGGNPGAAEGPDAFRSALYRMYDTPLRRFSEVSQRASHFNVSAQRVAQSGYLSGWIQDAGDIRLQPGIGATHEAIAEVVCAILKSNASLVVVVGGGHDFSYGSFKGHALARQGFIPIINLDAHFDLRPVKEDKINSGTPFRRIIENFGPRVSHGRALLEMGIQRDRNPASLYDFALEQGVRTVEYLKLLGRWHDVAGDREVSPLEFVQDHLDDCARLGWDRYNDSLHVSLDLDVFSASEAPGTSASTPMGVPVEDVGAVFSYFGRTRMCRVLDIAELCPPRDVHSVTSKLAAGLFYRFAIVRREYETGWLVPV